MKALFVIFLLVCTSVALAIQCKNCVSYESMEDCKEKEESVNCDDAGPTQLGFVPDRCVKMSLEYGDTKSFVKTCFSKQLCEVGNEAFKSCKQVNGTTCEINCCDSNYCNSGTAPLVSALLIIACALTSLYRY